MSNQFRIGGVYRRKDGLIVKLQTCETSSSLPFYAGTVPVAMHNVASGNRVGFVRLSDGMRRQQAHNKASGWHLLPGELVQVDGEWVSPTSTLDKMEAEKEELGKTVERQLDALHVAVVKLAYEASKEPALPALDWNKPTPFDPFKGYVTTSHTQDQQASNNHALQRCADFDGAVMKVR